MKKTKWNIKIVTKQRKSTVQNWQFWKLKSIIMDKKREQKWGNLNEESFRFWNSSRKVKNRPIHEIQMGNHHLSIPRLVCWSWRYSVFCLFRFGGPNIHASNIFFALFVFSFDWICAKPNTNFQNSNLVVISQCDFYTKSWNLSSAKCFSNLFLN